jgi:exopolyphosphatase / guanosine-5'-triphosphate,3'-diphosphate pyrophosphatase
MIAAAIDIGTNTTLALLAEEHDGGGLKVVKDQITVNRLGEAMGTDDQIPRDVIMLNVDLLAELTRDLRRAGAEGFAVAGTSALRRAQNRAEFLAAVREVVGLQIEVLGGREEAALTYMGALSGHEVYPGERVCVLDLGGGSTEIVEGRGLVPGQGYSIDIGAVYLTNEFFLNDPPTPEDYRRLVEHLEGRLPSLVTRLDASSAPWILVGGSAVTLAILTMGLQRYDPVRVGGSVLHVDDIDRLISKFKGKTSAELQHRPGMPAGRGRTIFAGAILLREMFSALGIQEGVVSERGLRHGLWLAKFGDR